MFNYNVITIADNSWIFDKNTKKLYSKKKIITKTLYEYYHLKSVLESFNKNFYHEEEYGIGCVNCAINYKIVKRNGKLSLRLAFYGKEVYLTKIELQTLLNLLFKMEKELKLEFTSHDYDDDEIENFLKINEEDGYDYEH